MKNLIIVGLLALVLLTSVSASSLSYVMAKTDSDTGTDSKDKVAESQATPSNPESR